MRAAMMLSGALIIGLIACGGGGDGGGERTGSGSPVAITATTGGVELLDDDGPVIASGAALPLGGSAFAWRIDTDSQPYMVRYALDGDLTHATRAPLHAIAGSGFEVAVALPARPAVADGKDTAPPPVVPVRWRVRDGAIHVQLVEVRRGTLALPGGAMAFVLVGDGGRFDRDDEFVAFDLDRDGTIDFIHLDSIELFHVFEHAVTLDGIGYALAVAPAGDTLTLRPLDHPLPPRPPLRAGTHAPDASVVVANGDSLSLAQLTGQVVLLDFWTTWCAPCVAARPHLRELRERLHARGFEVVSIRDTGTPDAPGPVGIEATDHDAEAVYRIDRYPSYFLIDRTGTIACARCTLAQLEPMIEPALSSQSQSPSPRPPHSPAMAP